MKYMMIFLFFIICSNACGDTDCKYPIKINSFDLPLSATEKDKIGYPDDPRIEAGPSTIIVDGYRIYFIDQYFAAVRSINLKTGSLEFSYFLADAVDEEITWLPRVTDIILFNNKIYIAVNQFYYLVILDNELNFHSTLPSLERGEKHFIYPTQKSFQLLYSRSREILKFDHDHNVINQYKLDPSITWYSHSKELNKPLYEEKSCDDNYYCVSFNSKCLKIKEPIQDIVQKYQGINVGYSDSLLIQFKVENDENKIQFYWYTLH